ncbi:MAG: ABC transporter permease subunit [Burkholderiales bacterium]|nr:ABC transporter permease subunit [Burkholderiales bacterium]
MGALPGTGSGSRQVLQDRLLLLAILLAAWQLLSWAAGAQVLTSPTATVRKLAHLVLAPDFAGHAMETGRAFALALVISLAGGLGLGVALGAHRLSGEVAEPLLVGLYSIPKITLYPIVLLLFGLGMSAKVAFGTMHGIIPVVLFTMNAVRNIPQVYVRAARAMRLGPAQMFAHVLVPASLPEIVTGFRFGFSLTLLGTLIGEMFASQRGIGYLLIKAMESNNTDVILALALLLVFLATVASWLLLAVERRVHGRFAG